MELIIVTKRKKCLKAKNDNGMARCYFSFCVDKEKIMR